MHSRSRRDGRWQRRLDDPLADGAARHGELRDVVDVQVGEGRLDPAGQPVLREELAVGLRRGGEPSGNPQPERRQLADHLAQGCVLAAHLVEIVHAEGMQRDYVSFHGIFRFQVAGVGWSCAGGPEVHNPVMNPPDANKPGARRRVVFFLSDQTGVTAEMLGRSLLTQFEAHDFEQVTLPFINTVDKADEAIRRINADAEARGQRPIIFATFVRDEIRDRFIDVEGLFLDFFEAFIGPLERELRTRSSHTVGRTHGMKDSGSYDRRIEATNFALNNDDGARTNEYERSDVILVGVSRSGKTPTCLYLALAYGVFAANYPLSDDEFESGQLPRSLEAHRSKLFGLTISPERLQQIRRERRATGRYASPEQVRYELRAADTIFRRYQIPYIDTTELSVEEIASTILNNTGIERRFRP